MTTANKEAVLFTHHRYPSEAIRNAAKLAIPVNYANTVDALVRNLTFGSIPHEGARIIASELAQHGYTVRTRHLFDDKAITEAKRANLVLVSAMDTGLDQAAKIIHELGPRDNLMIGGVGVNPVAKELSSNFPWATVVSGESENLISQAVTDYETNGHMEKTYQRSAKFDLADLAYHPASSDRYSCRELPMFRTSLIKATETSRGCPEGCEFCLTARQPVTVKSTSLLEKEFDQMKFGVGNALFLVDQNLMACPQAYLHDLFDLINRKNIKWIGEGTISYIIDNELLLRKMAKNCLSFLVGVEDMFSPIKGSVTKNSLQTNLESTVQWLRELKLPIIYSMVFGLDNQQKEVFDATADRINQLGITVAAHLATPRPGTPFWERVIKEGRLLDKASIRRNMRNDMVINPLHMTRDEALRGFWRFQRSVYSPIQVAKRFEKNLIECGPRYALSLAVTDTLYMAGSYQYSQKHKQLLKN